LLERVKVKVSLQARKRNRFGRFLGVQWKNFNSLSSVNQMKFTIEAWQLCSN